MLTFNRPLSWLTEALRLERGETPNQLDEEVSPVLDAVQGGWGFMEWRSNRLDTAAGAGAGVLNLVLPDPTLTRLVLGIDVETGAGAVAGCTIEYRDEVTARAMELISFDHPGAGTLAWSDLVPALTRIVVPPGQRLRLKHPALAAGQALSIDILVGTTKAGFKVL